MSVVVKEAAVAPESQPLEPFSPLSPEYRANPYAVYSTYRTLDPVHWGTSPQPGIPGCWYLFRYSDTAAASKDLRLGLEFYRVLPPEALPEIPPQFMPFFLMIGQWMVFRDPPDHARLRQLINKSFTPAIIDRLGFFVETVADELLSPVQDEGNMDVIAQLAFPLPMIVVGKLLGIPTENRENLHEWSNAIRKALDFVHAEEDREAIYERATKATLESTAFLRELIAERRKHPQDDLLSSLISAEEEGKTNEDEVIATCMVLLWAGALTPANLIGNGVHALLSHPEQLQKLRAHPELLDSAIDEMIRYDAPAQLSFRFALEDIEIGDKIIRTGEQVALVFGAANRDPEQFSEPDEFDISRADNHHLGFGEGIHTCVGRALGRIEGKIAITQVLQRMPQLRLQTEGVRWANATGIRGLASLPVSF